MFQEVWRSDGFVAVDGKLIPAASIEAYREQGSDRKRGRTRGGAQVRAKDAWWQ